MLNFADLSASMIYLCRKCFGTAAFVYESWIVSEYQRLGGLKLIEMEVLLLNRQIWPIMSNI